MPANRQTDRHTHSFRKCSHASVGLAQARPNDGVLRNMYNFIYGSVQFAVIQWLRP